MKKKCAYVFEMNLLIKTWNKIKLKLWIVAEENAATDQTYAIHSENTRNTNTRR